MKPSIYHHLRRTFLKLAAGLVLGGIFGSAARADMYLSTTNTQGGIPVQFNINAVVQGTNTTISWYGPHAWYSIQWKTNLASPWVDLLRTAATSHDWSVSFNNQGNSNAIFQAKQDNSFAGSGACAGCHGDKFDEWKGTAHSGAFNTLKKIGMSANANCVPCHSVGYGQPTGYTNILNTPHLTDVGCETCHGPAGWHKYSDHDLIRPVVSIDPAICGGCHKDDHHPTYEEWEVSGHGECTPDVAGLAATTTKYVTNGPIIVTNMTTTAAGIMNYSNWISYSNGTVLSVFTTNDIAGYDRGMSCGPCHSGVLRETLVADYEARLKGITNVLSMPRNHDSALWGPTCANCHDPHSSANPAQLRNPLSSTNYFTYATGSDKRTVSGQTVYYNTVFASQYNPEIQVCGQCHNSRGARWDGRSFALITSTNITGPFTNTIFVDIVTNIITANTNGVIVTYLTNSYVIGRTTTNQVAASVTNVTTSFGLTATVSYSRPPHHSPQYNLLTGIVQPDYLNTNSLGIATNVFGVHSLMPGGCTACHMPTKTMAVPTPEVPNYTGHEFMPLADAVGYAGCTVSGCHDADGLTGVSNKMALLQAEIGTGITNLVYSLTNWAMVKGPGIFGATNANKYKQNGWEYTTAGDLKTVTNTGPSTGDQLLIPAGIRQARFNLYMIAYGKSLGVHNPTYSRYLLNDASNKVWQASQ